MTLEESWNLVEHLNYIANQQSKVLWSSNDINKAICYQTECFKNKFLELEYTQQQAIVYWYKNDDEFQDYVKCLAGNDFIINLF